MGRRRLAAILAALVLLSSGCARTPPPESPPARTGPPTTAGADDAPDSPADPGTDAARDGQASPERDQTGTDPTVPPPEPTAAELSQQALAALERREYPRAAALFRQAAEQAPTADRWSDASYAHILARQWREALEAGERALTLDPEHPYAHYNAGVAQLELGRPCEAEHHLLQSARLQPDRAEPLIALARSYLAQGRHALAAYHADRATALAPDHPAIADLSSALATALTAEPEGDPLLTHRDGALTLSIYPSASPTCGWPAGNRVLSLTDGEGRTFRLPFAGDEVTAVHPVTLEGGVRGYWLAGTTYRAYVTQAVTWRLFRFDGQELHQVLFLGADDPLRPAIREEEGSTGVPAIAGREITTTRFDSASGTAWITTTWRLSADGHTATRIDTTRTYEAELRAAGSELRFHPAPWFGTPTQYEFTYPLAPDARIEQDGKPLDPAALQPGMILRLLIRDGRITAVTVLEEPGAP